MLHLTALKELKVTSVSLELAASVIQFGDSSPQVRLSAISEPIDGHQVAGRICVSHVQAGGPKNLFRMFRTGLFDTTVYVERVYLHMLWQACTMPYEYFNASIALRDPIDFGLELQELDLAFNYDIGRGKTAWKELPSEDWIV
ncbi:hypothetical protein [Bradyrhizobium sp. C9]|uniref:hypothetical protein n=1 Tax=Bradyrhizobium sp. C9 TaxID=142585 RepID=UPI001177CCF2|nr:hypothetical protein [Bradyrhizobium sp. C9]